MPVNKIIFTGILVAFFIGFPKYSFGQVNETRQDSIFLRHHSPRAALIYSTIFPGLGQAYNNKVWKIPILYAGFGTALYFLNRNQMYYNKLRSYYNMVDSLVEYPVSIYQYNVYSRDQLKRALDQYRNWRDYSILSLAGIYLLNMLDAYVDAYMFEYDVSDDLSLKFEPGFINSNTYAGALGMTIKMRF